MALLRKGLEAQPQRWQFAQDIGFVYYWWLHDYKQAAEWFTRAAAIPGAPDWLKPLAAVTLAQGGNRASSRRLWEEIQTRPTTTGCARRQTLRLQQFDAMDQIDILRRAAAAYELRFNSPPRDVAGPGPRRIPPSVPPVDPAGHVVRHRRLPAA